eukprot:TRINITY_DN4711_c0_g1_i2.p1 TRINITY_DN4711_c0_g1~~TRINITY_DN4711_c0_g1_i2.p1  ORF type:complete len:394 (-),score=104.23 TRINITY_DN4711_c0_g1_i2:181-1362(-)
MPKGSDERKEMKTEPKTERVEEFTKRLKECVSLFTGVANDIEERIEELKEKEEERKRLYEKVNRSFEKIESQINLNIGGQRVSTSKETLTSMKGTYFYAMLSSDKWQPNAQGEYFIDRNPTHFHHILDYLRTGELHVSSLSELKKQQLLAELDYYQITLPKALQRYQRQYQRYQAENEEKEQQQQQRGGGSDYYYYYERWQWSTKMKGKRGTLTNNNKTAIGRNGKHCIFIGEKTVRCFKIKIIVNSQSMYGGNHAFIGMIQHCPMNYDQQYHNRGWFIDMMNGQAYDHNSICDTTTSEEFVIFPTGFSNGDEIEFEHDRLNGTIRISVNDKDKGVVFKNVPINAQLYPCFDPCCSDSSVEIRYGGGRRRSGGNGGSGRNDDDEDSEDEEYVL